MHDGTERNGTRRGIGIMVEDKYLGTVALETAIVIT